MRNYIGKTMIGSHIWKMNNEFSDEDYFEIYSEDIDDILRHTAKYKSEFIQDSGVDTHQHEISHVVEQLLKGNINFIIGVLSPIIKDRSYYFSELRKLTRRNLSKNCFHSINGMCEGNYVKYILEGRDTSEKKYNQILRHVQFGINILTKGRAIFKGYSGGTPDEVLEKLSELKYCYEISPLPEKPDEDKFRWWLFDYRLHQIRDKIYDELWYI